MKVRFGIIGIGKISHRFMKGIQLVDNAEVTAIASRDQNKAVSYAHQYRIARYYGSYEELAADPDIDAIYIATPPPLHYEHAMLCLRHRKHVLCEKPFMTSEEEINEVFSFARKQGCFVMEAQKSVFLPATKQVKQWIADGVIGKLQYVEASYCYHGGFPEDHFIFDRGGGSMFDVGVYPLSYLDYVVDQPIQKIDVQTITNDASIYDKSIDMTAQIMMKYESGILGYVRSSISIATPNRACFYGDQGWIEVEHFWKAQECHLHQGKDTITLTFPTESEFRYQIEETVRCIQRGVLESEIMSWRRSYLLMEVLEKVKTVNQY